MKASYVAPTGRITYKTPSGKVKTFHYTKSPAVVLLPDTGKGAAAAAEATKLAALGIGSLVVESPASPPTNVDAFDTAVAQTLQAVKKLKAQPGVNPHQVGIIGEGVGAHVGAVAIGKQPGAVVAAVLADIGGVVVPDPAFAPEKWLQKADGVQLLYQRDQAKRAMTSDEVKRLMLVSPAGTLMEQYPSLGTTAQQSRDEWIKGKLLAG